MQEICKLAFDDNLRADHKLAALMGLAKIAGYITDKHSTRVIRSIEDLTDEELAMITAGVDDKGEALH